jgi:colicin import membrane protein
MQRASDRWVSIALSVLLHGALLAALVYGWLLFRQPPRPAPTLAIEATVVDARAARGALSPPQPAPPAPPPQPPPPQPEPPQESPGPPPPTPEEVAQREKERAQAEQAAAEQQRAAEQKAAAEQAAKAAEEKRQAEARAAAERKAQEQQRAADAQERTEQLADLKRNLAAEEQADARSGPALANWESLIAAKITRAWLRPPTARPGIECMLYVTQVPGGEVTQVRIGECNGDQAVRESIEAAVYRASPLPPPPDPTLFDRNLKIDFKPD